MLAYINTNDALAAGRLLEFLSVRTAWHRSLWGVGVVLAMDELFEACGVMKQGHLSEASIKRMSSSLQKRVGQHPAFTNEEKDFLRQQIQQVPRADGVAHFAIRELSTRVTSNYLTRWGRVVAGGAFKVEHFARSVAAHLLDAGFSSEHLYDFINVKLRSPDPITLNQLCDALQAEMQASPLREFEALLAFTKKPKFPSGTPTTWLSGSAVSSWLVANNFETTGVRAPFALVVRVRARDVIGAAQAARNESDRFAARLLLGTGEPLYRFPQLWVRGAIKPALLKEASRGVSVKELFREDRVFSPDASQSVDAALELLAHLEDSSPPAAIAGGWGAIEGLLADPSDRATAADNLATLVTCSFPRAELTALSHHVQRFYPGQFALLEAAATNRERSRVLAQMIINGQMPDMPSLSDKAAVLRMQKLLRNPGPKLQIIKDSVGDSFHRLYRQRNLILHGGRLDSVAVTASLRTVAKLAGAGMDRITHGHYVQGLRPMELVAKANLGIAMLTPTEPLRCLDLLEIG